MPSRSACNGIVRVVLIAVGAAAVAWASAVLVVWPPPPAINQIAGHILRGEPYKPEELDRVVAALDAVTITDGSRAASLRAAAIIGLRQVEAAIAAGRRPVIDDQLRSLDRLLSRSLSMAPSDSFLWLALFWRNSMVEGVKASRLPLLAMSYRLGPNEGWIGVRRSPLALALLPRLPQDLAERVVTEFVGLVNSGFPEMARILVGPGWAVRDRLLPRLAAAHEIRRKGFARAVYHLGYDVVVPGVEQPNARPWHR